MDALLTVTLWNVALLAALLAMQPMVRTLTQGLRYALSNFDTRRDDGVLARRLAMVRSNQLEALALWVPLVLVAAVAAPELAHPSFASIATVFLIARLAYVAITLAGLPLLRSVSWLVGFIAWAVLAWVVLGAVAA